MGIDKELERLHRRLQRITRIEKPPTLKMVMIGASEEVPETSPWEIVLKVEGKNPAFNK